MRHRPDSLFPVSRILQLLASCFAFALIAGCAEPLPPEHVAAISKMQGLGGKVVFEEGGYRLNMTDSRIQDDDLAQLANVQNLTVLDLRGTQVTDAGVQKIIPLKSLVLVLISGSRITDDGVAVLKKARPDIRVAR